MQIHRSDGGTTVQPLLLRLDNTMEIEYYRHGGILHKVLRERLQADAR